MRKIKIYNFVFTINVFFIFIFDNLCSQARGKKVYLYSDAIQYKNEIDEFINKKKFMFSVNANDLLGHFKSK